MRDAVALLCGALVFAGAFAAVASGQTIQFGHTWGSTDFEAASSVIVDGGGNVTIAGIRFDPESFMVWGFVAKFDPAGRLLWNRVLSTSNSYVVDMVPGPGGDVFVLGSIFSNYTGTSSFAARISASGDLVFAVSLPQIAFARIASDPSTGGFYLAGTMSDYQSGFVAAFDPAGGMRWARVAPSGSALPGGVAADSTGRVTALVTRDSGDLGLVSFDGGGSPLGQRILRTSTYEGAADAAFLANGDLVVLGYRYDFAPHFVVARLTAGLDAIWTESGAASGYSEGLTRIVPLPAAGFALLGTAFDTAAQTMSSELYAFDRQGRVTEALGYVSPPYASSGFNETFALFDGAAFPGGGVVLAGTSVGVPPLVPASVDVTVAPVNATWATDAVAWRSQTLSSAQMATDLTDPSVPVDDFSLPARFQAWWGVVEAPPTGVSASIRVDHADPFSTEATFAANVSGGTSPYGYRWSFGDGTFDTSAEPNHAFPGTGRWLTQLWVQDSAGIAGYAWNVLVVRGPPAVQSLRVYPNPVAQRTMVSVYGEAHDADGGGIVNYLWDYGDGWTDNTTQAYTQHTYLDPGNFTLTLTVTDGDDRQTASLSTVVTVVGRVDTPPYACFSYDPRNPTVGAYVYFQAYCSYDPDGYITAYLWDFGDGTVSNGTYNPSPIHAYSAAGTYVVTLTVTDDGGLSSQTSAALTVSENRPPVANFSFSPRVPRPSEIVYFDGRGSYDPDGYITTWIWDFGDGTSGGNRTANKVIGGPEVWHAYAQGGDYLATLTVVDNAGAEASAFAFVHVDVPPVAMAHASRTVAKVGTPVSFDGNASYDPDGWIAHYAWQFGDGGVAEGPAAGHVFATPGTYVVTLIVVDNDGTSAYDVVAVTVLEPKPPVAVIAYSPARPLVSNLVSFDASNSSDPDGSLSDFIWQFGDGGVARGPQATHRYSAAGSYTVQLTVVDEDGLVSEDSVSVTVVSGARGTVTTLAASVDRSPLEGATVRIFSGDTLVVQTTTKADGTFDAGLLDPGAYTIEVSKPGYVTKRANVVWTLESTDLGTWVLDPVGVVPSGLVTPEIGTVLGISGIAAAAAALAIVHRRRRSAGKRGPGARK